MKKTINKILTLFKKPEPVTKSQEEENEEIISAYNDLRRLVPSYTEPNYDLARKVFHEFNDFNLKNLNEINHIYHPYIPASLLPYPKNYIKCAYYIYRDEAQKDKNQKLFDLIQQVGVSIFCEYPDYNKYKENLKKKKWMDEKVGKQLVPEPREAFKKLYGVYEVSEEDYYSSPSAVDVSDEKLIHDFGLLPDIEKDVSFNSK